MMTADRATRYRRHKSFISDYHQPSIEILTQPEDQLSHMNEKHNQRLQKTVLKNKNRT